MQDEQDRDRHGSLERPSRVRVDRIRQLLSELVVKKP